MGNSYFGRTESNFNDVVLDGSPFEVQVQKRRFSVVLVNELHTSKGGRIKWPRGIAVNEKGEIVVTDYEGHCVVLLDNAGKFIRKLGTEGESEGHFKRPVDVTFVNDDDILVADEWAPNTAV